VPVIVVWGWFVHAFCCAHKPVHACTPHVFATPFAPHSSPVAHVPQLCVSPPQPFASTPQLAAPQAWGTHAPLPVPPPHSKWVPSPPQKSGAVHAPQSIALPQPSPTGPQVAFALAQVTRSHGGASTPASPPPGVEIGKLSWELHALASTAITKPQ
ncbi:MAG TPA: hypothetical protein VF403_09150, partial [Kofleriaceae bacterium]